MPRRKKTGALAPTSPQELKSTLWKAADKLRGSLDSSQYKDVVLGLIFLKYVSDAFDERHHQIAEELAGEDYDEEAIAESQEDPDEYLGSGVFWVHPDARWDHLVRLAKVQDTQTIGQRINEAMDLLMEPNESLSGTLPRLFNRENIDQQRLAELLDLLNSVQFAGGGPVRARDLLGEVYEYFLGQFASSEGKRGGEFYTPASVVRTIVEVLQPGHGRVYDPCCGSGGMFVQAEKFLAAHHSDASDLSVYGQELNEATWRMAKMNLAIHGLNGNLGPRWGDTFSTDYHAGERMDFIMANPPFNISDWNRREEDARWVYGVPPAGNANYGWIQHILAKLAPGGSAGVVMANGSMTSNSGGEGEIRANIVENDLVAAMVALPEKLFRSTGIPVCLWFFAKDKTAGAAGAVDRTGQVLFIDARRLGHMVTRAERAFSNADIHRIADTYHAWRGMDRLPLGTRDLSRTGEGAGPEAPQDARDDETGEYEDVPGFCKSVTLAEIKQADYALTPGRYVGMPEPEDDGEPLDEKITRLTAELEKQFAESERLQRVVREKLGRLG